MRVENLVMFAGATSVLHPHLQARHILCPGGLQDQQTSFRLIQLPFDADEGEEQSGDGGDQQVVQHQHVSAVPTS
jgi:hypothetical protein